MQWSRIWVVLLYYELCEKVWVGSSAREQLESGLESRDLNNVTENEEHDENGNLQSGMTMMMLITLASSWSSNSTALLLPTVTMRRWFLDKN